MQIVAQAIETRVHEDAIRLHPVGGVFQGLRVQRTGSPLPTFHLRAVNGDSLLVTSPAAVSPTWATKIRGVHFLFWGVNKFGIVQQ